MGTTDSHSTTNRIFGDYDGDGDVDREDVGLWLVLALKIVLPVTIVLLWLLALGALPAWWHTLVRV